MTTYALAASVAVIKNMMVMGLLNDVEAASALWALVNEASPNEHVHYKPGMSAVVDTLVREKAPAGVFEWLEG